MRRLRLKITSLVAVAAATGVLAGCAAPAYTYAADSADSVYFKVPSSWHQVDPRVVAQTQSVVLSRSALGPAGGAFAWSRAYTSGKITSPGMVLADSVQPVVYASVQMVSPNLRDQLSFNLMRDILIPVTSSARQQATAAGANLTGFQLLGSSVISTHDGVRGINELFQYTLGGLPDVFDQTVLTNSSTTKLYVLLVQCFESCFAAHQSQIAAVVRSFTVRGS